MSQEAHELDRQVLGVVDDEADAVTGRLRDAGYDVEIIQGEEGRRHLDAEGSEHGGVVRVKRFLGFFGDERRILERLDEALAEGATVLVVHTPEDPAEVSDIMQDADARFIWRFDGWTHERVGD